MNERRYIKLANQPARSDDWAAWGAVTLYLEVNQNGLPLKQAEVYANGPVLRYDQSRFFDEYGMLINKRLSDDQLSGNAISEDDFLLIWTK